MKTCPICDISYPNQQTKCPSDGAVLLESRELAEGHIVRGKYRILRKLGQGGMGTVYLAEHLLLGGKAALKFLAAELCRDPQFVKRFRNEARAAYQLRHPNIVEVVDLDQDEDGSLFIAMEYVFGPSLRSVLSQAGRPLSVTRALHIARDVASGVAVAHSRGAIHRDIKPDNILIGVASHGGEQAKVLDFGIAVITEGVTNLSRTHGLLLTPEYAAPEQWRGTPATELDGRTDLYALGGILYEMLSGRTPFRAANPEGWMFQHLHGTPQSLQELRPELASDYPELESVVMKLLAREREQRFESAEMFLEAIDAKQKTRQPTQVIPVEQPKTATTLVMPVTTPSQAPLVNKRKFRPLGLALSIALLVVVVGTGSTILFLRSKPQTAVPVLSPNGGTYSEARNISISDSTPQAVIHFTLDGSPPSGVSPVYSEPLTLGPSGAVVRAMATAEGLRPSSEVRAAYIWPDSSKVSPNGNISSQRVSGTVTNLTRHKVSEGDSVTLIDIGNNLKEIGKTVTDAQGRFTFGVLPKTPYLVRVEHQSSPYFKNFPANTTEANVNIYDVAAKVEGVLTEADVLRIESEKGQLKVTENYFVKNVSSPPRTQLSEHTYEVVLPPDAALDGAAAVGPNVMPVAATLNPVQPKGHYAFNFPIRPNEGENGTRFQLTYHVPYSGNYKFSPKLMQETDNFALILAKGITIEPAQGATFQLVPNNDNETGQTYLIRNVKQGQVLGFTVSGDGHFTNTK